MSANLTDLFNAYEALPAAERHQFTVFLLRKILDDAPADLSEESLVQNADLLFQQLDREEEQHDSNPPQ